MQTLNEYKEEVMRYASGRDVLPDDLRISSGPDGLSTWYAPFEYVNVGAKIVLCGITPGLQQADAALAAARDALRRGESVETAQIEAKRTGSFAGVMRTNLVSMLDSIEINRLLNIESCTQLFGKRSDLVHYTSALRYPVLKDGSNYSGDSKMIRNSYLWNQILEGLHEEAKAIPEALWIPLGPDVGAVFEKLIELGVISESRCLLGMPHASGANSERIKYFLGEKSRESLSSKTNAQLIDERRNTLVRKIKALLESQPLQDTGCSAIGKGLANCEPVTQMSSPRGTIGKLMISAKVARGKVSEILLPHLFMLNDEGILMGAWQYDNSSPRDRIYPYLIKKKGATEKTFDVSLSGQSSDYKGVKRDEFIRKLISGSYPSGATVRMRSVRASGSKGNGWLIRNINLDPGLTVPGT